MLWLKPSWDWEEWLLVDLQLHLFRRWPHHICCRWLELFFCRHHKVWIHEHVSWGHGRGWVRPRCYRASVGHNLVAASSDRGNIGGDGHGHHGRRGRFWNWYLPAWAKKVTLGIEAVSVIIGATVFRDEQLPTWGHRCGQHHKGVVWFLRDAHRKVVVRRRRDCAGRSKPAVIKGLIQPQLVRWKATRPGLDLIQAAFHCTSSNHHGCGGHPLQGLFLSVHLGL